MIRMKEKRTRNAIDKTVGKEEGSQNIELSFLV